VQRKGTGAVLAMCLL